MHQSFAKAWTWTLTALPKAAPHLISPPPLPPPGWLVKAWGVLSSLVASRVVEECGIADLAEAHSIDLSLLICCRQGGTRCEIQGARGQGWHLAALLVREGAHINLPQALQVEGTTRSCQARHPGCPRAVVHQQAGRSAESQAGKRTACHHCDLQQAMALCQAQVCSGPLHICCQPSRQRPSRQA